MKYRMAALLVAALAATGLAACGEKPQRLSDEEPTLITESWQGQVRERTMKQGESGRMDY